MSDYRRFVSYIYAYKYGKKEKNTGFAKVEARNGNLKISIQLENSQEGQGGLDAYGFVRKGEKLYGIPLGELTLEPRPSLRVMTSSENVAGSGYPLRSLAGLWLKGNQGENHITIWDDEPITRMDLEVEIETAAAANLSDSEEEMMSAGEKRMEGVRPASSGVGSSLEMMESKGSEEVRQSVEVVPEALQETLEMVIPAGEGRKEGVQPVSSVSESSSETMVPKASEEAMQSAEIAPEASQEKVIPTEGVQLVSSVSESSIETMASKISEEAVHSAEAAPEASQETQEKAIPTETECTEGVDPVSSVSESSIEAMTPKVSEEAVHSAEAVPEASPETQEKAISTEAERTEGVEPVSSVSESSTETMASKISEEAVHSAEASPEVSPETLEKAIPTEAERPVSAVEEVSEEASTSGGAEPESSVSAVLNQNVWKEALAEQTPNSGKNINGVRAQEAASMTAAYPQCFRARQTQHTSVQYAGENEKIWNNLSRTYPHLNPFPEGEALDCVRISPRELHLFRRQGWNAPKNTFMLHGYYNFRHLIFGQFPDGSYFLGVPGYYSSQEQRVAASFGFPIFKDGRNSRNTGRLGYWCRPL